MADAGELNFLLKFRDEASAVLKQFTGAVQSSGQAHAEAAKGAKEHAAGLDGLADKAKEATEALAAMWAMSELSEKTLGAFAEVEVAMLRLSQASGIAGDALGEVQEKLVGLAGHSLNQTVEQLDGVATAAARLGLGGEQIEVFTKTVSQLATVTGVSVEQVKSSMETILAATGETAEGAHKFGEVFAYLADKTRDGGQGLMQAAQALTMMTAGMGLSSAKTLELASAVENLGVRARSGSLAIGQVLQKLDQFASNDRMVTQLGALAAATGMTTDKLKELIKSDPSAALLVFEQALKNVISSGGDATGFLKEFGLQGRMIQTTLVAMAKHLDEVKGKMAEADQAAGGHGLEDKYAKYMGTLQAQFHEATVAAIEFGVAVGQAAAPVAELVLGPVVAAVKDFTALFTALPAPIKDVAAALLIGIPAFVAAQKAWTLVSEAVLEAGQSFLRVTGLAGRAAETVVEGEKAALAAEAGWGGLARGLLTYAGAAFAAYEAGRRLGDIINQQRELGKQGVTWGDEAHALMVTFGLESREDFTKRMQAAKDAGQFKPNAATPGEAEPKKEDGTAANDNANPYQAHLSEWTPAIKQVQDYNLKLQELQKDLERVNNLKAASDETLKSLNVSREDLDVQQRITEEKIRQIDPMTKLRESWADQLAAARAYSKEQQEQVEVEKQVAEARRSNPRFSDKDESELRAAAAAKNDAERYKSFQEEMKGAQNQLAIAASMTQVEKDRLGIEQKLADLAQTKGYTEKQLEQLRQVLELTKQIEAETAQFKSLNPQFSALQSYNEQLTLMKQRLDEGRMSQEEFNREKTKLDNDTLSARDPIGAIVESQKEELAQLQITGQYREADLKTLQQITELKKQGLLQDQGEAEAVQAQLGAHNRQVQDIQDTQKQLDSLTDSFGQGLGNAIEGALTGKRDAFQQFAAEFGKKMFSTAFDDLWKQIKPNFGGLLGGMFGQAQGSTDALAKLGESQAEKTLATASMTVHAANVTVSGAIGGANQAIDNATQAGALTGTGSASSVLGRSPSGAANDNWAGAAGSIPTDGIPAIGGSSNVLSAYPGLVSGLGGTQGGVQSFLTSPSGLVGVNGGWESAARAIPGLVGAGGAAGAGVIPGFIGKVGTGGVTSFLNAPGLLQTPATAAISGPSTPTFQDRDMAHVHEFRSQVSPSAFDQALMARGYSPEAAAGITGNAMWESGGNKNAIYLDPPTGPNTGDAAWGAMQWEGARKNGLRPTLDSTVGHIDDEIRSGKQGLTFDQINHARSAEEAARMVDYKYERPQAEMQGWASASGSVHGRERYAAGVFDQNQSFNPEALKRAQEDMSRITKEQTKAMTDQVSQATKATQSLTGFGTGIGDVATKAASGVPDMSSFSGSISEMLSSLTKGIGGGGGGGLGGIVSSLVSAVHTGGVIGNDNTGMLRSVNPLIFAGARRFHDGLGDDEFPAILQKGERVLTAQQDQRSTALMSRMADVISASRASTPAGTQAAPTGRQAGGHKITMIVNTPNASSFRYSQSQIMAQTHAQMSRAAGRHN